MIAPNPKRYRLLVYFAFTMFMMYNTFLHICDGIRPFDWVMLIVEVLVLVLIGYEVLVGKRERRIKHKRELLLAQQKAALSGFMAKGDQLRQNTPNMQMQKEYPHDWIGAVDSWSRQTADYLAQYSLNAGSAFTLIKQSNLFIERVELPNSDGRVFRVESHIRESYQRLVMQLSNLAEIVEKVDLYF